MKEIATLKTDSEFKEFLEGFRKDPDSVFNVRQLKEIFDLAK